MIGGKFNLPLNIVHYSRYYIYEALCSAISKDKTSGAIKTKEVYPNIVPLPNSLPPKALKLPLWPP
jgi:hypothetical protein